MAEAGLSTDICRLSELVAMNVARSRFLVARSGPGRYVQPVGVEPCDCRVVSLIYSSVELAYQRPACTRSGPGRYVQPVGVEPCDVELYL